MVNFNYSKLKGRIIEILDNNSTFFDGMGWSRPTFNRKIAGESEWTDQEIMKAAEMLQIEPDRIPSYFFVVDVQT